MASREVSLRKRQQIDSSKRTMFLVVAVAAFISGGALVVSFFLVQQVMFHTDVIGKKRDTLDTIEANITAVKALEENVRVLDTNEALMAVRLNGEDSALQVILDALPAEANSDALGASLQIRLAGEVSGLRIDGLSLRSAEESSANTPSANSNIMFEMSVHGTADMLKEFMMRMERSIRVIELTSINIQSGSDGLDMKISGQAFYEPKRVIELKTETFKPGAGKRP